ncbi:MAG: glycosyltransferase family 2 protein [Hyphomonadaceae bacterium]
MPMFSVIIVNYNGGDYIQRALDSLARQTCQDFEVFLIDNASTDGSIDNLETGSLPAFKLMPQDDNLGFAEGNNIAAKCAGGTWLALLNPDAEAESDWLETIEDGITRHPGVNMFASTQYDMHNPELLDGVGDAYLIFGFPWRGGFGHPVSALPVEGTCFSPCGAGAIYKRDTFLEHGGFDERFFCYCEDVDLGFRMRLSGETCVFLNTAVIHHAGSALSGRSSDFSIYHGTRNRLWVYAKNMPALLLMLTLPGHIVLSAYLLARAAMSGRTPKTWSGMRDGLAGLSSIRKASPWSPPKRRTSLWSLARSMAWNPFYMSSRAPHVRQQKRR